LSEEDLRIAVSNLAFRRRIYAEIFDLAFYKLTSKVPATVAVFM